MTHQALPTDATDTGRYARALARLRGPEIQAPDGSRMAADLLALGGTLAALRATVLRAIEQAHPGAATDLLAALEEQYGLPSGAALPLSQRQARLLAKVRARGRGTLQALGVTARTVTAEAVLYEISWRDITGIPDDGTTNLTDADLAGPDTNAVFDIVLLVSAATWANGARVTQLDALFAQQAPAHVLWATAVGDGPDLDAFRCDDPNSLVERDVLAA